MKSILEMSNTEAKEFLLKQESYANFELPQYFVFHPLLQAIDQELASKNVKDYFAQFTDEDGKSRQIKPDSIEDVNYKFLNNKDGRYAWRPFQLIHPVLYVSLVQTITEDSNWHYIINRFNDLHSNPKIICYSIPLEATNDDNSDRKATILNWWNNIEQKSLELSLYYDYVYHTDITDCYSSIYTHSIAWALHDRAVAKTSRGRDLLGNIIDEKIRWMTNGQTNGIPQGSVLMDFIAEMVLCYADKLLSEQLTHLDTTDYQIIRYRDDYRIFSTSPVVAEEIMKCLTEVLVSLGLKISSTKSIPSSDLIRSSIKEDKLYWDTHRNYHRSLQKHLLIINELSHLHPNSGSLYKAMKKFLERISKFNKEFKDGLAMSGIVVNIAHRNPRVYPVAAAIISELISSHSDERKVEIIDAVLNKFNRLPNTGHIKIWLQRVLITVDRLRDYGEKLCKKVNDNSVEIWNSSFLKGKLAQIMESSSIVDEEIINNLGKKISLDEIAETSYEGNMGSIA